jgi:galactokinase
MTQRTPSPTRPRIAQFGAAQIQQLYKEQFKQSGTRVFQAPGRVNLIGEHTDYNDGFVMPATIDFHTWIAAGPRDDSSLVIHSVEFQETVAVELQGNAPESRKHWSDYPIGVALELRRAGVRVSGANLLVAGNVPLGAGLSSSASIEVATGFALSMLAGAAIDLSQLALICQRAENEFVGARCGIMDQFISAHGKANHALLLDCRSLRYELFPLPQGISLVICDTGIKHLIAGGEYNLRRRECEEGVELLRRMLPSIKALRDVSLEELERNAGRLPPTIYRRCRHVVSENERTLAAARALQDSDLGRLGQLMRSSHESLRDDYNVSCAELDALAEIAWQTAGVIGARMTGGGFGGCTINLVQDDKVEDFRQEIAREYHLKFGNIPEIYATRACDGVSELEGESESSGRRD